jgi:hypothetical protein
MNIKFIFFYKKIYTFMREEDLLKIIKILTVDCEELLIEIDLGPIVVNSIEVDKSTGSIIIHQFKGDFDIEMLYRDLDFKYQEIVYRHLSQCLYN